MAQWKKIIVSGSGAHLQSVTASNYIPFKIGTTNDVAGFSSTVPLVWDGASGHIGTGSAYAIQGGTDYVAGSDLTANYAIVGAGGSSIKKVDELVSFANQSIDDVDVLYATRVNADDAYVASKLTVTGSVKLGSSAAAAASVVTIDLIKPTIIQGTVNNHALTSSTDIMLDGLTATNSPIIEFQSGNAESSVLKDRIVFNTAAANQQQYSIQTSDQGGDYNLAEFKILNYDTTTLHARSSKVGIGGAYDANATLKVHGAISGSGALVVTGIANADGLLSTYDQSLVYDSTTGTFGYAPTNTVGGITSVIGGDNINVDGTGDVEVNLDASLLGLTGVEVDGIVYGDNLKVSGSGTTIVSAQHITASNLLVDDTAIFNGTFLFSGIDFTVQNASTFSGSNQFGSGSAPSNVFHEFTGSVNITGSLAVDGGFIIDDLTVTGNTILGDNAAEDTVQVNADVTLFAGSTLDVRDSVILGQANDDTLTVNAAATFNSTVTIDDTGDNDGNLTVGGDTTIAGELTLTGLAAADSGIGDGILVRNTDDTIGLATTVPVSALGISAGDGIYLSNAGVISADSGSMAQYFRENAYTNIGGDITVALNGTAAISANVIVPGDVAILNDSLAATEGHIMIAQSDGTYLNKAVTGVITIDADGATSFNGSGVVDAANAASASYITGASADVEYSIIFTDNTGGSVTQSLKVDSTAADFTYNPNDNVLTVGGSTFGNNVVVNGDLTVNGNTVTMNTETLLVEDNFIGLNSNLSCRRQLMQIRCRSWPRRWYTSRSWN